MLTNEELLKKLGENIRRERVSARLTQEKLSELSCMDITNLQRIEAGRYNTKVLTLIALKEALDVSWETLLPEIK